MPLSADKEQTVASSAQLALRLSQQALGKGKTASTQVRRLGIDDAPRQVTPSLRPAAGPGRKGQHTVSAAAVRKHRVKQALKRARFAKRLLKAVPMGRIFFGGILPAASFGHEIQAPTKAQLGKLQSLARQAMAIKPVGVPGCIRDLQVQATAHPEFQAMAAPHLTVGP
jgi:hypothetical protein